MSQTSLLRSLVFSFLTLSFTACGSSGGGGGGDAGPGALGKLPADQKAAVEAWLKAPVKSCEAIEVIGGGATQIESPWDRPEGFPETSRDAIPKGLDIAVLAERTGQRFWLTHPNDASTATVLTGAAVPFNSGDYTSKFEMTSNEGGASSKVTVETNSSGYDCTVKINGEEVAKRSIAKSVEYTVVSSSRPNFAPFRMSPLMVTRFQNGVLQIEAGQLIAALAPQNSPQTEHLFSRIGYSTEIVAQYFKLASNDGASAALRSSRGELTFAYNRQIVLSNAASDRWPRAGETKQLDLVSVYQDGAGQIGGVTFGSGDGALRVLAHRVSIEGRSTPQGTEFAVQDLGASPTQTVVPTKSVVDQCVYDRSATLALISYEYLAAGRTVEPPLPEAVFGGCTRLESGVRSRYESSDDALKIAQVIFGYLGTNWDGRSGFNFGGWVGTLRSAVLASLQPASDKSVSNGGSAVLTEIDVRIQNARRLAEFSALSPKYREVLADVILSLSAWSKVPANDKWLERVMRAAVRLDDVYVRPFKNFAATSPDAGRESQMVYLETASASLLKLGREVYDQALVMPDHTYLLSVHEYFFSRQPKEDYLRRELVRMRGGK